MSTEAPAPVSAAISRGRTVGASSLDRLIHGRLRLGIMSALAVNDNLTFAELRDILGATDGNLSVHARKLERAQYIDCHKFFAGRKPRTEYRISSTGRAALARYLAHMEALIAATKARAPVARRAQHTSEEQPDG